MVLERDPARSSVIEVLDRVLDKGIVVDASIRISVVGIELVGIDARVVVASVETYLRHADALAFTALAARPSPEPPRRVGERRAAERRAGSERRRGSTRRDLDRRRRERRTREVPVPVERRSGTERRAGLSRRTLERRSGERRLLGSERRIGPDRRGGERRGRL